MHRKKHFGHHGRSKSGQGYKRSSSANFQKVYFLSSFAQKKHFGHHRRSKSGQGHPRLSSANFPKVYFGAPMHKKCISDIMGGQHRVKVTKGHQVQIFKKQIQYFKQILVLHICRLVPHVVHKEGGRQGGREGEREISLEKSDNGIIRQNTDVEIQVPQGGPINKS